MLSQPLQHLQIVGSRVITIIRVLLAIKLVVHNSIMLRTYINIVAITVSYFYLHPQTMYNVAPLTSTPWSHTLYPLASPHACRSDSPLSLFDHSIVLAEHSYMNTYSISDACRGFGLLDKI